MLRQLINVVIDRTESFLQLHGPIQKGLPEQSSLIQLGLASLHAAYVRITSCTQA